MRIEGKQFKQYFKTSKWHLLLLILWTVAGFGLATLPEKAVLIAVGANMTIFAPLFMAFVFGHLGHTIMKKPGWGRPWQAVFAGAMLGLITGFLAGVLMLIEPKTGAATIQFVLGTQKTPTFALVMISGITTAVLRAVYGGLFAWIGGQVKK